MYIETTITIHPSNLKKLEEGSEKTGESINKLITHLFKRMMLENKKFHLSQPTIAYQSKAGSYIIHHIYLTQNEYEQKLDMRRFYKMSAAKILALAIELFLNEILDMMLSSSHLERILSVYSQSHRIIAEFLDSFTRYSVLWGNNEKYAHHSGHS